MFDIFVIITLCVQVSKDSIIYSIISLCSVLRDKTSELSTESVHFHSWSHEATASFHTNRSVSIHVLVCVCLVHQVIVHEVPGQELEVEVYDKDPDQDDFLGRYI